MSLPIVLAVVGVFLGVVLLSVVGGGKNKEVKKKILEGLDDCDELCGGDESSKRDCVVRLDRLLGESLQYAGLRGESVGERLKQAGSLFKKTDYNEIWTAHKLRNKIIHENIRLDNREFSHAVKYFNLVIRRLVK